MQDLSLTTRIGPLWRRTVNAALQYAGPILVLATVALGTSGFHLSDTCNKRLDQDLYRALQHFALAIDPSCGEYQGLSALNISRFLAATLLAFAVIRLLFSKAWSVIKLQSQALWPRGERYVLIGYGAVNQEIARDRAAKGAKLTIVDRGFDGAARDFAATHRVVLLEKDVRDERALRGLHLQRAEKVIIACGEDSLTQEIAQAVSAIIRQKHRNASKGPPEHRVFAHFMNSEVHRQLQLTSDAGLKLERKFTGFSIREETARHFFSCTWLAERAARQVPVGSDLRPRLHVAILGAGDLGTAMVREAAVHGCCARLGPPLITVMDRDRESAKARIRAAMPRLFDTTIPKENRPEIRFIQTEADAIGGEEPAAPSDDGASEDAAAGAEKRVALPGTQPTDTPVTGWVICCTEDDTNLATAMRLEGEMQRGLRPPAPIYPRIWQANVRGGASQPIGQEDAWHLVAPFGGMQDVIPALTFLNKEWTTLARSIHQRYLETLDENFRYKGLPDWKKTYGEPPWAEGEGPEDPERRAKLTDEIALERQRYTDDWDTLDDEARLSNMASAQQAALRLWELGFDWQGRYDGRLPSVTGPMTVRLFSDEAYRDLGRHTRLGAVCDAEHRRWMVERALRGWGAAVPGARSNRLRLHPDFRTYDTLYSGAKSYLDDHGAPPSPSEEDGRRDWSLRMLDAASVRGIMEALPRTGAPSTDATRTPAARPAGTEREVRLDAMPTLYKSTYRLAVTIPSLGSGSDAGRLEQLEKGLRELKGWMEHESSFTIRVLPGSPEAWGEKTLRQRILEPLHAAARAADVTLLVEHANAAERRAAIARPPASGEMPKDTEDHVAEIS